MFSSERSRILDRRAWTYLGSAAVATVLSGVVVSVLAYVVLAGAAAGAWLTKQHPLVRWTLTGAAVVALAALVLGLSTSPVGHGSRGGPVTRH